VRMRYLKFKRRSKFLSVKIRIAVKCPSSALAEQFDFDCFSYLADVFASLYGSAFDEALIVDFHNSVQSIKS
jgi:hypothetical protein